MLIEGSTVAFIVGGILVASGIGLFVFNWRNPVDDYIPSISEAIKNSKVVWGFWHSGNRARESLYYGSVKKILLLEPEPNSEAFKHVLSEVSGRPTTAKEIIIQIGLTKDEAVSKNIDLRWHNEVTSQSFMICDPSPTKIEGGLVEFSHQAFVVAQVLDRNLNIEEWAKYKKNASKDKYAFDSYVEWFKDVWDNKSKPVSN
jgi:hypothetical protein